MAGHTCNGDIGAAIGSMLSGDRDLEDSLWGPNAMKEKEIIEKQRVQLTTYINDVTILFPYMQEANLFNRDDKEIINAPVTTTAKVDKFLDVMLTKGPRAIGVFHEALNATHHLHLFNYLAQLFTQAGIELPPSRQMKDEEEDKVPQENSRPNRGSYRHGSRSLTVRKRLEVMSRQCEMMQKEKDDLQRALSDREKEISSLLSTKEHVQSSLNVVTVKYSELLTQLAHWRTVLESDGTVKEWISEKEGLQTDYDELEQDYKLQCSELNAARDRIAGLLVQLERGEKMISLTQEACQKEKDVLKHRNQRLKKEFDSISNHSGPEMHSPQTPHKFATLCPGGSATPSFDDSPRAGARFDSMDVFMPAPEADAMDWRMTRFPTIETDYEFPITGELPLQEPGGLENGYLGEGGWELVGKEDAEEEEEERAEEEREGQRKERRRGYAQRDPRHTGPLERSKAYYRNRNKSKSMDDLNQIQPPARKSSRSEVRPVALTQEMFLTDIRLVGGRGYGIFIQTDSRRLDVETGDEILEIAEKSVQGMTHAEVVEQLESFFQQKKPAHIMVHYNGKTLSQVPTDAKDNFHVRCRLSYRPPYSILGKNHELSFEKGDILHITNTLPAGHKGFWEAQKVGSKGEVQGAGLVPTTFSSDMTEEPVAMSLPRRFPGLNSPKGLRSKAVTLESQKSKESVSVGSSAFTIYQPIRKFTGVAHPRPVVLLGALQRDIRRHLINYGCTEDIKFCYSARVESSKLEGCEEEDVVERLILNGKEMISTKKHVDKHAREGYHCVLCVDPENLNRPGLQSLIPIVLLLDAKKIKILNSIRQSAKLPQDGDLNLQEQIDYAADLKRYRQYFTGQIDLQGTMSDVVKEVRATIARQQKSIIWESDD